SPMADSPALSALSAVTSTGEDVATRLLADGYVVVTDMMSDADVQTARADLGRVLESTKTGRNAFEGYSTQRVYALFAKTRTFDRAATHPLLLDVLDRVLGFYQLSAPVGIRIGPGEKAQILHRDDAIYPLPKPHPLARRRREPDEQAQARCDSRVRGGLAPPAGEPLPGRATRHRQAVASAPARTTRLQHLSAIRRLR